MNDVKIEAFFSVLPKPIGMKGDEQDDIIKKIVMMDLDTEGGFVYFNELLYKAMKREYGDNHIKNKMLAMSEYKAYQAIQDIKDKLLKQQREQARLELMSVNPFLILMFKRISFKLWKKKYDKNKDVRD